MRKWLRAAAAVLLLAGLLWYFWPRPSRVLLVGVDAGADYLLDEYLASGKLPADGGFAELARRGVRAEASVPIDISVTAPSFASLHTGAYPERHGLMGNTYYRVRDPLGETTSAFDAPWAAEPLWEPVRRAGKRVALIGNDAGAATPGLGANLILGYAHSDGASELAVYQFSDFTSPADWQLGGRSFEHARAVELVFRTRNHGQHPAGLLLVDTVADGTERYDRALVDFDRNLANGLAAELTLGQWAPVSLPAEHPTTIGAWIKLVELAPNLSRVRLYLGAPHYNIGQPVEFIQHVERGVSRMSGQPFWPGGPDNRARERGWIDEATWLEQMERLGNYIRDAALWTMEHERFDLLITYQPQTDEAGHEFLLSDPRQAGYGDAEEQARQAENLLRGWRAVDANLKALVAAAGPNTNVLVVADHGMIPTHTRVFPNRLLAARGLRVTGPEAEARVVTSSGQASVYINLAGRQPGGVVSAGDYPKLVERLARLFAEWRDPVTREPVLEVLARREEMDRYHILHEETSGDLWLSLKPGYQFSGDDRPGAVFEPEGGGGHGYLASFRQMQTIFLAAGPQIRSANLGVVNNVDVAPTVARILGVEPPRDAQGRALEEMITQE